MRRTYHAKLARSIGRGLDHEKPAVHCFLRRRYRQLKERSRKVWVLGRGGTKTRFILWGGGFKTHSVPKSKEARDREASSRGSKATGEKTSGWGEGAGLAKRGGRRNIGIHGDMFTGGNRSVSPGKHSSTKKGEKGEDALDEGEVLSQENVAVCFWCKRELATKQTGKEGYSHLRKKKRELQKTEIIGGHELNPKRLLSQRGEREEDVERKHYLANGSFPKRSSRYSKLCSLAQIKTRSREELRQARLRAQRKPGRKGVRKERHDQGGSKGVYRIQLD